MKRREAKVAELLLTYTKSVTLQVQVQSSNLRLQIPVGLGAVFFGVPPAP
jgi:hypothetical protein